MLRISTGSTKWLVWFIIVSVNVALGVAIAITWLQCDPIEKTWNPTVHGKCWNKLIVVRYNIFTASESRLGPRRQLCHETDHRFAVYSGAMDAILAIVPWKIVWKLSMNKREKAGK